VFFQICQPRIGDGISLNHGKFEGNKNHPAATWLDREVWMRIDGHVSFIQPVV